LWSRLPNSLILKRLIGCLIVIYCLMFLNKLSTQELLIIKFKLTSKLFYIYNFNNFLFSSFFQTFINNPFLFVKQLLIILLITLKCLQKKEHLIIITLVLLRLVLLTSLYRYNIYFLTFNTKVILIIYALKHQIYCNKLKK
jgi:hypothetical protein